MEIQTEHKSEISNIPIKGVGHGKGEFWERIDSSLPLKWSVLWSVYGAIFDVINGTLI